MRLINKIILLNQIILLILFAPNVVLAEQVKLSEADHVDLNCTGQIEYRLPDSTRVDCLLDDYAIEYDWATNKVYECITPALLLVSKA